MTILSCTYSVPKDINNNGISHTKTPLPIASPPPLIQSTIPTPSFSASPFVLPTYHPYKLEILAGNGLPGALDGWGVLSQFNQPQGIALDQQGNLYISDVQNHTIRKLDTQNRVQTIAGNGKAGFRDGVAQNAQFSYPQAVAVDKSGNLYIADTSNHRIRKIDRTGQVQTIAGSTGGFKDGDLTSAQFAQPVALMFDSQGDLLVTQASYYIRKLHLSTKVVKVLAGKEHNEVSFSEERYIGKALEVQLSSSLMGVALDSQQSIYFLQIGFLGFQQGFSQEGRFPGVRKLADQVVSEVKVIPPQHEPIILEFMSSSHQILYSNLAIHNDEIYLLAGKHIIVTNLAGEKLLGVKLNYDEFPNLKSHNPISLWGIAINKSGEIYLTDKNNHLILKVKINRDKE